MKTLTPDTVPLVMKDESVELRLAEVGEMTVSIIRLKEGTDLGPALVGMPHDSCPCPHWGYMTEGRLLMRVPGGDRTYEAGEAFYWAAGHAPFALTDCAYVDFSPTGPFMEVIAHLQGNG